MIERQSIVCFSNNEWSAVPTSKEHVMKLLSLKNRVLYVENLGSRPPKLKWADWKRIIFRLGNFLRGARQRVNSNLIIYSPLTLPFPKYRFIRSINQRWLTRQIKTVLKQNQMKRPILWLTLPMAVDLIGRLDERLVIYHCIDDYSAFETLDSQLIARLEDELIDKSDIILVANYGLYQKIKSRHTQVYYFPHGVNFEHFHPQGTISRPKGYRHLPPPRIGFAGKIGYSTDLALIDFLARRNPQFSFVLIGPITFDVENRELVGLKQRKNVHFIGRVSYNQLPAYLAGLDVCLLPFRLTRQIKSSQPQIMMEYLALGKPIVSVDIGAAGEFNDLINIAKNRLDFNQKLIRAVTENKPELMKKRIKIASVNSWSNRVEQASKIISEFLNAN